MSRCLRLLLLAGIAGLSPAGAGAQLPCADDAEAALKDRSVRDFLKLVEDNSPRAAAAMESPQE